MAEPVTFKLHAAPLASGHLPRSFQSTQRSANPLDDDPFLPAGYLKVDQAFDLRATARSTDAAHAEQALRPGSDQVVVLELPDGVSVITHPQNLHETLARIDPAALDADGAIVFERALQTRGAAVRGGLGDAVSSGLSSIVTQVYTLTVGHAADPIIQAAKRKACEWLGEKAEDKIEQYAELGVSWAGTKALMWAIESRLKRDPGLYRWIDGELTTRYDAADPQLKALAAAGPLLVMIHGTGSSTAGSFDSLQSASSAYWKAFEDRYGERILAFEHRTLSESPADNALQLARALPEGATIHLVTHSRGGLVGDLMCLANFEDLIAGYALDAASLAEADPAERERITQELLKAHAEQRSALHELAAELRRKQIKVERYVRVASPARGTRLASGNFDVFLSGLLSLMGWVPAFKGNPIYSAFKRVVIEIARNRTQPNLVPGIEAMLPGSPMARFLASATPQDGLKLAVISGDIEGGGWLKRLGVLFTDYSFFDGTDNDLVVDTDAMSAGIARAGNTRVLFDQGPEVSHFRYFVNEATRSALRSWLTEASVETIAVFKPLRGIQGDLPEAARRRGGPTTTSAAAAALPVTVLLPGIMGSHLWLNRRERVWFSISELALGGLAKLRFKPGAKRDPVEAEALFAQYYGDLHEHLACNQRVVPVAYDWRQPLDVLADRLALVLRTQLDATAAPLLPVRVLAHSMGGLVVRALIHKHPELWDELMARDGARFVMLGTPNQGSHLMVETLVGKADTVRKLGVLDQAHDLQEVIDIIGGFPGALQLLPKPGFVDTGNDASGNYFDPAVWGGYKKDMHDLWFGDGIGALPNAAVLGQAQWLWTQDGKARPALPAKHEAKTLYVFGCAAKTPCGITRQGNTWKMLGTPHGDGSVTWDSGRIDGIGQFFYMPAEHGALPDTAEYFDAIGSLLERGVGGNLMTSPPAVRGAAELAPQAAVYDAGPVLHPTDTELAGGLFGGNKRLRSRERPRDLLTVKVRVMDLRQVTTPILVGHYEQDAISGAEALIDRHLVHGELTIRHHLGLYAGAVGTASAVLLNTSAQDRQRGSLRGAVVAGLGKYDGSLTVDKLMEAVRTAGLRYLVHALDSGAVAAGVEGNEGLKLASLLMGYNSAANLSIADSVQALLRGVIDANRHFAQTTHSKLRITELDIVEMYLDTAITATYAAKTLGAAIDADPKIPCRVSVDPLLHQGEGMRQRLFDRPTGSYWPRLMITDADHDEGQNPSDASRTSAASAPPSRIVLAERLRYLYLGQRARAEAVVQQRQPGLVERLVERQMMVMGYDADFSRTLFQLLVPHDFKDAARQMQQMVFVLDSYTANLPWELMLADETPLAVRTAMVRQLASTHYRQRVSQTIERRAYVVGNPSTEGVLEARPDPKLPHLDELDDLPAAEKEALTVAEGLARHGFDVDRAIGRSQRAIDVVNGLYKHPYRIVHIAGHGMFDEGLGAASRSGVVLSDGLLITAAEIDAMEIVPDLVFLNCCHLGKIERSPVAFNKLAYSVARQLIDIGVRAVVVAGWAVEDAPASLFAETFYDKLLSDNLPFGDAVFQARRATWDRYPASITWGAYQAYGDPSWRADPRTEQAEPDTPAATSGVTPEELLDRLERERIELQRAGATLSSTEAARLVAKVRQWFDATPPEWVHRPDLMSALGELYADLGEHYLDLACECFRRAIKASDKIGRVPIKAIEHLASCESRLGESHDDARVVARAINRLTQLLRITDDPTDAAGTPTADANPERAGLLGSAWKRKAAVHARAYLKNSSAHELALMTDALQHSIASYHAMASQLGAKEVRPYQTLNWLFLRSIRADSSERLAYVPHVRRCAAAANAEFSEDPMAFNSTMVADAALVVALLDGSLAVQGNAGDPALAAIAAAYEDALQGALVTPRERDLVLQQIRFMALFHQAYEKAGGTASDASLGTRLAALSQRLSPDAGTRSL